MHPVLVFKLLILIAVANGIPLLAKKLLGSRFAQPIDGGIAFIDGRPLFGPSKTVRGVVFSLLLTPLIALPLGFNWQAGLVIAAAVMAGDLLSSFIKRRLGLAPSSRAIGLDQIPEALLPLLASSWLLPIGLLDIVAGVTIFWAAAPFLSRLFHHWRLRDQPY